MRGKDHIKRQMQLQEQRGEGEESVAGGYKTGPREMAKLRHSEREELVQLRKQNKILQDKVKDYQIGKARMERVWNSGGEGVERV